MTITKIQKQRGRSPRYILYLDGLEKLELSDWIIAKYGLRTGDEISRSELETIKNAEMEYRAKNIAINFLSYRPRCSYEVMNHLLKKGFSSEVSENVVKHLGSIGMIDDEKFAYKFVQDRIRRKQVGTLMLRNQLLNKGIASDIVDNVISELFTYEDQYSLAVKALNRRLKLLRKSRKEVEKEKIRNTLVGFLLRRGFTYDIAVKAVNNILEN